MTLVAQHLKGALASNAILQLAAVAADKGLELYTLAKQRTPCN